MGAGFVRNAVWDHQHRRLPSAPAGDVDVIWFDPHSTDPSEDRKHEAALRGAEPSIVWSVRNQARMHTRNGDPSYTSAVDAMRSWPETATAIVARRNDREECEIATPFGMDDLLGLVLRPTPRFAHDKHVIYKERLRTKRWITLWPLLKEAEA